MKLSYRRANKALKKSKRLPFENAMLLRAERKVAKREELAYKSMLTFITRRNAYAQLLLINSQMPLKGQSIHEHIANKTLAINDLVLQTADAITKIWSNEEKNA